MRLRSVQPGGGRQEGDGGSQRAGGLWGEIEGDDGRAEENKRQHNPAAATTTIPTNLNKFTCFLCLDVYIIDKNVFIFLQFFKFII